MQKFKIAFILPNSFNYTPSEKTLSRLTEEKVMDDIEDFIEFKEVNSSDEMMEVISEKIGLTEEIAGDTVDVYSDHKHIYQMCFVSSFDANNKNINYIGSQLTEFHHRVIGTCAIIKADVKNDCSVTLSNIYPKDVLDIYMSHIVHKCVSVKGNGSCDIIKYIFNPLDWMQYDKASQFRFHEIEIFDRVLMVFIETSPEKKTNEFASILLGKHVYGNSIIALRHKSDDVRFTEYEYIDIYPEIIKSLVTICSTNQDELKEVIEKNPQKAYNFYTLVGMRLDKYKSIYSSSDPKQSCIENIKKETPLNEQK